MADTIINIPSSIVDGVTKAVGFAGDKYLGTSPDGLTVIEKDSLAGGVQSVVAGTNVTVDNTDPLNPIVSASGGGNIDIGTTVIDNGTDGRILFQEAGKVSQSAGFSRTANGFIDIQSTTGFEAIKFKSQYSAVGYLGGNNSRCWLSSNVTGSDAAVRLTGTLTEIVGGSITFLSNTSVEYARFNSLGFLGIGTNTPTSRLHVKATDASATPVLNIEHWANGTSLFNVKGSGVISATNLPTSSAGLVAGDIWNDAGTLKIV